MDQDIVEFGPDEHERGNKECGRCWGWAHPLPCQCGGFVHAQFFDESNDDPILIFACDKCGDEYCEVEG